MDKSKKFQLMTAVLVADQYFRGTESLAASPLAVLIPKEKQEEFYGRFHEFKGWELFCQKGPFEGIDKQICLKIMQFLLLMVQSLKLPVIFGALDKAKWEREKSGSGPLFVYGGTNALDICFRACVKGVVTYIEQNHPSTFALLISDYYKDEKIRDFLHNSFLDFRKRFRPTLPDLEITHEITTSENNTFINVVHTVPPTEMPYLHDDMYFGDSRYSVGIQLADLCGYVIAKHLAADPDPDLQRFYELIEPQVMYSRIEPGGQLVHPMLVHPEEGHDIRVSEFRQNDAAISEGAARENKSQTGSGEAGESKKAEG
jgi:hypothetical protein